MIVNKYKYIWKCFKAVVIIFKNNFFSQCDVCASASDFAFCWCRRRHEWQQLIFIRRRSWPSWLWSCGVDATLAGLRVGSADMWTGGPQKSDWLAGSGCSFRSLRRRRQTNCTSMRLKDGDLWHSRKINLNKRKLSLPVFYFLPYPEDNAIANGNWKCKFARK